MALAQSRTCLIVTWRLRPGSRHPDIRTLLSQFQSLKLEETGGCFIADFKDTMRLADLKPSHQLAHFKQSVPEEAKRLLYLEQVETVEHAFEVLTELYEP